MPTVEELQAEVTRLSSMLDRCDEARERVIAERDTLRDAIRRDVAWRAIERALRRYDDPREMHNRPEHGGFPRGELAWAMAQDLRDAATVVDPGAAGGNDATGH